MKFIWYKCEKFYRGGSKAFQIRVPDCELSKDDWEQIMEWIGENTDGGHSAGYRLDYDKLKAKDRKLPVVSYPNYLIPQTMGMGKKVVTTSHWI